MYSRSLGFSLLTALLLSVVAGCNKSADTSAGAPSSSSAKNRASTFPPLDTIARVHWLGIKRLAAETNAAYFMSIWNLPETARLEAQTFDKLASAIMRQQEPGDGRQESGALSHQPGVRNQLAGTNDEPKSASSGSAPINNPLRPLLEDLIKEESYLEIRAGTNQPDELALAIRLDNARSLLWQTNLAAALESGTGTRPAPNSGGGWQLVLTAGFSVPGSQAADPGTHPANSLSINPSATNPPSGPQPLTFRLQPSNGWTLLGLATGTNSTLNDLRARIARNGAPFAASPTNYWLDAQADLPRLSNAFGLHWRLNEICPKTTLTVIGDGQNVRTHGLLDFRRPLPLELEPWNIPTNLIHDPLIGFTALRGFRPWLDSSKLWKDLQAGATPNQAYIWDQEGMPAQEYCAAPFAHASNVVYQLSESLERLVNPWLQTQRLGQFQKSTNSDGIAWQGAPFVSPDLRSVTEAQGEFALFGLIPLTRTNLPPPPELLHGVASRTNLLYYDWEITGQGLDHWLYLCQLGRFLAHKAQLPTDCASFQWLKAVAPKLGNCVTLLTATSPTQIELVRRSSFSLGSIELHLLVDWLESPKFPHGLHTFLASLPPAPAPPISTNSVSNQRK